MEERNLADSHGRFRRHGLFGAYAAPGSARMDAESPDAASSAWTTSLPLLHSAAQDYRIWTTGDHAKLPSGGAVAMVGSPRFADAELQALADASSPAAAVASGYPHFGDQIFRQLHGSFACCIVDSAGERLIAAIDRLGQHTLYYHDSQERLAFGSEASAVTAQLPGREAPAPQGIYNYVYFHMVPSPGSVHRGLRKLPAAHYLEYSKGQCRVVNYWLPRFAESPAGKTFPALCTELRDTLREAVHRSLPGTGKVGAFLSGGLDSSTVAGILSEVGPQGAEAFSIGFSAEGYDEMAFARTTARHFGIRLNEYYVTPQDVVDALPLVATSYDEPFGNSSALPAYFCARMAAAEGVQTLLAGDGGDELFGGNERYLRQRVFARYGSVPGPLRRGLLEPLIRMLPAAVPLAAKAKSYVAQANTPLPDRLQSYNFLHRHAAAEIFPEAFLAEVDTGLPIALLREIYHRPELASDLNRMLYLDWQITLADNDLRKVSQMCALAGVDVNYPMIDDVLVDFSCRVPSNWKIQGGNLRHFYKEALRGWLPDETINKSKQGFGLPFGVWMRTFKPLQELAYDNLQKLKSRGFIRPEFIDRAISMHQSEHAAYYGELVWILTVFELWLAGRSASGGEAWKF